MQFVERYRYLDEESGHTNNVQWQLKAFSFLFFLNRL